MQHQFDMDAVPASAGPAASRYDAEFQQKVVRLSIRLEQEHKDALTRDEIELAAAEVGIEPQFIRHAISVLTASEALLSQRTRRIAVRTRLLGVLAIPVVWGTLSYALSGWSPVAEFLMVIAPAPLAVMLGFISRRKLVGVIAGGLLSLCLTPAAVSSGQFDPNLYLCGTFLGAALGYGGAAIDPEPAAAGEGAVSRQEFVTLLNSLSQSAT